MRRFIILASVMLVSGYSYSQNTEQRVIGSFNKIDVTGEVKVFIVKGDREVVDIKSNDVPLVDVSTEVKDSVLYISLKKSKYNKYDAELVVSYKNINSIDIGAAGYVSSNDTLRTNSLQLNAVNGSEFDSDIVVEHLNVKVGQGSIVRLRGFAKNNGSSVSSWGKFSAYDLKTDSTNINIGTKAIAKVFVSNSIVATIKPTGTLTLTGSPKNKTINSQVGSTLIEE